MKTQSNPHSISSDVETMKAVRIHAFGGLEELVYENAPKPAPGPGDVLVRVHAAGVNPVDWKIRRGDLKDHLHHRLPLILGWDMSGVVEAVGGGVTTFQPGDEVLGRPDPSRDGAYADYIVVRAAELGRKPAPLDHLRAAGLSLAGLTAWQALFDVAGLAEGQSVLVHAASGGVGSVAVQLAKWKGARVFGTASESNQAFLKQLGVDTAIDYKKTRFEDVAREVDVVIDTIGGDTQRRSWATLKKGGILVSLVQPPVEEDARRAGVRAAGLFAQSKPDQIERLAAMVVDGTLHLHVDKVLPLDQARDAQAISESHRALGKIVLKVV
jgi:NADPH:quinone reductase-like Zn-dependent oxidoreductase